MSRVQVSGFSVWGSGFGAQGLRFRWLHQTTSVGSSGFGVEEFGCRIWGVGFKGSGVKGFGATQTPIPHVRWHSARAACRAILKLMVWARGIHLSILEWKRAWDLGCEVYRVEIWGVGFEVLGIRGWGLKCRDLGCEV